MILVLSLCKSKVNMLQVNPFQYRIEKQTNRYHSLSGDHNKLNEVNCKNWC